MEFASYGKLDHIKQDFLNDFDQQIYDQICWEIRINALVLHAKSCLLPYTGINATLHPLAFLATSFWSPAQSLSSRLSIALKACAIRISVHEASARAFC